MATYPVGGRDDECWAFQRWDLRVFVLKAYPRSCCIGLISYLTPFAG